MIDSQKYWYSWGEKSIKRSQVERYVGKSCCVTVGISGSLKVLQFYLFSRPPREILAMIRCKISQESVGGSDSPRTPSQTGIDHFNLTSPSPRELKFEYNNNYELNLFAALLF